MAKIIGDYTGTTFDDFLVLPGYTTEEHLPGKINVHTKIAGVELGRPYLPAAMRSVVGKDMALHAGKNRMMAVAPRGLSIEDEVAIVRYVKDMEIKVGQIESEQNPEYILDTETLGSALEKAKGYGHSNMPVQSRIGDFSGIFTYDPLVHDRMNPNTPIKNVMKSFKNSRGDVVMEFCKDSMPDNEIKDYITSKNCRMVPVLDDVYRLRKLVFLQQFEAYKVGAAIDSFPGWEKRANALVEAGADMIFTDTSHAYSTFIVELVKKYKHMFPNGPPICAGNLVTPDGFRKCADAGADAVKLGMGPGSICTTNDVLGVGAPPFWSLVEVSKARDEYAKTGRYIAIIADGGMEKPSDMNIALTHADAVMAGRLFAGFRESAGKHFVEKGVDYKEYFGEASPRAYQESGNMHRYNVGGETILTHQGVSGRVPCVGRLKPGTERYTQVLKEALSDAGCKNLEEYRECAVLIRLSERAKQIKGAHGIEVVE